MSGWLLTTFDALSAKVLPLFDAYGLALRSF